MPTSKKIILGIDPGFADTGFGVILKEGQKLTNLTHGSIKTSPKDDFINRLNQLHIQLSKIIKEFKPDLAAVEQLFFAKNVKTAMLVGQARGVVLLTLSQNKVPLLEFTPLEIKQALTGYGKADKKQIGEMVKLLLNLKSVPKPDDAADALAAAITGASFKKRN